MITVGINGISALSNHYATLPFADARIVRTYDLINVVSYAYRKITRASLAATDLLCCTHSDFGINRVDLLHMFNAVSLTLTPWVVTFEHYLPRWNMRSRAGLRLLAGSRCRKIIAMSRFAYDFQMEQMKEFPAYRNAIHEKLCVIPPSQKRYIGSLDEKPTEGDQIVFTFVGRDFFRKGGMETLRAFERVIGEGYPVKLHVVSDLSCGDYATGSTLDDVAEAKRLLNTLAGPVEFREALPNDEIMRLFIGSHVGLLPTYDDTFGYSVLEAQAAGCPVITTDSCALSEINDQETGWIIPVPKDPSRIALWSTTEGRRELSRTIEEGLYRTIREICEHPDAVKIKGTRALARVKAEHDPVQNARSLEGIYREAVAAPVRGPAGSYTPARRESR